ncbi:hypothetical protein ASG82_24355 [Mycobacterium sp. Soil538]|nr:hypothetical protein ASG82_24355 [Mycobacterium sp. Soil538]
MHQSACGDERRAAALVGDVAELTEQQCRVRGVVAVPARPACAEHPGHPVERLDFQPGIVGHCGKARRDVRVTGLGQRVRFEGRAGLGCLVERRDIGQ